MNDQNNNRNNQKQKCMKDDNKRRQNRNNRLDLAEEFIKNDDQKCARDSLNKNRDDR